MTVFSGMLAAAEAAVDAVYSEGFSFTPMREARNLPPVSDNTRAAIAEFKAIFDERGTLLPVKGASEDAAMSRIDFDPMLSVRDAHLPQGVRRFDRVTRLATSIVYEVKAVMPDGLGRSVLILTKLTT